MIDNNVPLQSQSLQWFTAVVCSLLAGALWHLFPHPALIVVLGIIPLAVLYTLNRPFLMVLFFVIFFPSSEFTRFFLNFTL